MSRGGRGVEPRATSTAFHRARRKRTMSNVTEGTQYAQHQRGIFVGAHPLDDAWSPIKAWESSGLILDAHQPAASEREATYTGIDASLFRSRLSQT
jgi:hypothetical protein